MCRLFLVEGLVTLVVGIWSKYALVPSITQTKTWWRPKGWFTEREEKILVNRLLRDDPNKGDLHQRQSLSCKVIWRALCDINICMFYVSSGSPGLTIATPPVPGMSNRHATLPNFSHLTGTHLLTSCLF